MACEEQFPVGIEVEVLDDGMWCRAEILEVRDNGKYKVKFTKYNSTDIKKKNKIRPYNPKEAIEKKAEEHKKKTPEKKADAPKPQKSAAERAEQAKEKGNRFFKKQKWTLALQFYSEAIRLFPTHVYYSNRAMAYLKDDEPRLAEKDCDEAIKLNPKFVKAFIRRGWSRKNQIPSGQPLQQLDNAIADFKAALKLDKKNKVAKSEISQLKKMRPVLVKQIEQMKKAREAEEKGTRI